MLTFSLLVLWPIVAISTDRRITWLKHTSYHDGNILTLQNGWTQCEKWDQYNSIPGQSIVSALCIKLQVPLDLDDSTLNEAINYNIARIYSHDDINNSANNGAFWMIQGNCFFVRVITAIRFTL